MPPSDSPRRVVRALLSVSDKAGLVELAKDLRFMLEATEQALKDYDTVCQARDALGGPKILGPQGIGLDKLKGPG